MPVNVLLVDDNPDSITLVERQLRKAGDYQVDSIGSGTKCLEMLRQKHYDILLLDYKLPGMNGLEVLESIVKRKYDLPVVMITAQGDEESAVSALKKGAYEYLSKSGDFLKNIPSLINRVIERHTMVKKKEELERELIKSEEKYRTLVNSAMDGVISVDQQMKVMLWNPAAERIFGYTEEEMLGQDVVKIVPQRCRKAKGKGLAQFRKTGSGPIIGKAVEVEGLRKDGSEVPIELCVTSRKSGKAYVATAIARDVTERKRAEEELEKRLHQLERFQKITMGRELRIIELKKELERLRKQVKE